MQLSSVSTALLLAVGIGIFEAVALSLGSGPLLSLMGISPVRDADSLVTLGFPGTHGCFLLSCLY